MTNEEPSLSEIGKEVSSSLQDLGIVVSTIIGDKYLLPSIKEDKLVKVDAMITAIRVGLQQDGELLDSLYIALRNTLATYATLIKDTEPS